MFARLAALMGKHGGSRSVNRKERKSKEEQTEKNQIERRTDRKK